jgi:hypothetical protein
MSPEEDLSLATHPFRGLLRTSIAVTVILLIVGALWCVWAAVAGRRLKTQIDAIAALHQPFRAEEFSRPKLPDAENAAVLWQAVFAAVPTNDRAPANSSLNYPNYPPFPSAWHQMEDQSIVINAPAFLLAEKAAKAQHADWGDAALNYNYFSSLNLGKSRQVANVLADGVIDAHFKGDDQVALERAVELLQEGRAVSQIGPQVARLVGIGIDSWATDRLFIIAPDLHLDGERLTDPAQKLVSPTRVKELIHLLLDETGDREARELAVDYDRLHMYEMIQAQRANLHLLLPMANLSEARMLERRAVDRLAADCPDAVSAARFYAAHPAPHVSELSSSIFTGSVQKTVPSARMMESYLENGLDRYEKVEWIDVAHRRMAAVSLAIRLYHVDHRQWPATLSELVPVDLDSVPTDPFMAGGPPVGYVIRRHALSDGGDRPMIYCGPVGDPQTAKLSATPMFGYGNELWRDVSRWYPASEVK